jgi:hypothetical protein
MLFYLYKAKDMPFVDKVLLEIRLGPSGNHPASMKAIPNFDTFEKTRTLKIHNYEIGHLSEKRRLATGPADQRQAL